MDPGIDRATAHDRCDVTADYKPCLLQMEYRKRDPASGKDQRGDCHRSQKGYQAGEGWVLSALQIAERNSPFPTMCFVSFSAMASSGD